MDTSILTIGEIKKLVFDLKGPKKEHLLSCLETDSRKGVKNLSAQSERSAKKDEKKRREFDKLCEFEKGLRKVGYKAIAGVDESGRGALAGPLVAAAVVLPPDFHLPGLKECKQVSAKQREEFYQVIKTEAIALNVVHIKAEEIDEIGIQKANLKALKQAALGLNCKYDYLLIDGFPVDDPQLPPNQAIVNGDNICLSIAAASIISKVTRDSVMVSYHKEYPDYHFHQHKGYGTNTHIEAIKRNGHSSIHRTSFTIKV